MMFRFLPILVIVLLSAGCASRGTVDFESGRAPLALVQKAIDRSMPKGIREVSPNGRIFSSKYFTIRKKKFRRVGRSSVRYYIQATVLGDRRPYTVEITAYVERLVKSDEGREFEYFKRDQRVANRIAKRIQKILTKGRDDRNVIDDFRVF